MRARASNRATQRAIRDDNDVDDTTVCCVVQLFARCLVGLGATFGFGICLNSVSVCVWHEWRHRGGNGDDGAKREKRTNTH